MGTPMCDSVVCSEPRSACVASNSFFASSETYFTLRSGATRIDGTPATIIRLTMLVIAGVAASTGNGTTGAFGNGSISTIGAVAVCTRSLVARAGEGGGVGGIGFSTGAACAGLAAFVFLGLSQFPQRIPCEIAAPHMKHLAIDRLLPGR